MNEHTKAPFTPREQRALRTWLRLVRAARAIESRIDARMYAEFGQRFTRFDLMSQLYRARSRRLTVTELGGLLLAPSTNISRLLDRMQADGLVRRQANRHDRRSLEVVLTARGRDAFERMARAHALWVSEALRDFDDAALARMSADLRRLARPVPQTGNPATSASDRKDTAATRRA